MSDRFTPETFTEAYWNAEWEAMSQAQRECLVAFVDAALACKHNELAGFERPRISLKVWSSKAMHPYLKSIDHRILVLPDAFALVEHARTHFRFPKWRYLRQWRQDGAVSLLQTRDEALAEQLLQQPDWKEITESAFKGNAQVLSRVYNGYRKVPVNTKGS